MSGTLLLLSMLALSLEIVLLGALVVFWLMITGPLALTLVDGDEDGSFSLSLLFDIFIPTNTMIMRRSRSG